MTVYFVFNQEIHDQEKFKKYITRAKPAVLKHGGKMLINEPNLNVIEGKPNSLLVVLEFESEEAARKWYDSSDIQDIIHMRLEAAKGWAVIAPKYEMPSS